MRKEQLVETLHKSYGFPQKALNSLRMDILVLLGNDQIADWLINNMHLEQPNPPSLANCING